MQRRAGRVRDRLLRPELSGTRRRLAELLAASPFVNFAGHGDYVHNMSIYRAHSGALVWATGTMDWSWGLAPGGSSDGAHNNVRPSLQRLTENVLRRMLTAAAEARRARPIDSAP